MNTIIGHELAKHTLISNPQIQSWLFHGSKGIGKATLAYYFAQHITQFTDFKCYNPDILTIHDNEEIIGIEKIRNIKNFLHLSTARSNHKLVIIDSIDNLNINATNAMLKILEEPPNNSIIILISHNLHSVPVVIRSRCFTLGLSDLNTEETQQVLKITYPDLDHKKISHIYPGTPGMVNQDITEEIHLYENLIAVISKKCNNLTVEEIITTDITLYKIEHILLTIILDIIKETLGITTSLSTNHNLICTIKNNTHTELLLPKISQIQHLIFSIRKFQLDKKASLLKLVNILAKLLN
ncbi:AAA family ATPase [Ehrlichia ruminantium]|uniref:AAA family ATPase n=1 Tax=Ehrlichia ruminantium TaxID=779 RepID=A0AAE6Q9Y8_EHRRU|nr:AAA family ATPase [Ehrlichia ruminantium]QGR02370.1 AAA family ATPase [Ehrlichia ruminantium]QGR03289.1 AAA family ATPase [Ehrlichia ruminantium]QGR04215.1 AAA family ATPase [Ehrlichia ruminantium]